MTPGGASHNDVEGVILAKKTLERSKFGRLLARFIEIHHGDPAKLRKCDTVFLVNLLEMIVNAVAELPAALASQKEDEAVNVLRLAEDGDRRALVEYLKSPKNPITSDIRTHLIEILSGKKRAAKRHKSSATTQRHRAITAFVASRMFAGRSYTKAVQGAQKEFRCSYKTITNACDEYGDLFAKVVFATVIMIGKINPISDEIMRRGEPEHCERAQELLERHAVATDKMAEFIDENDKAEYRKITAQFLS